MRMRKLQDLSSHSSQCKKQVQLRTATSRTPLSPKINSLTWSTMANNNSIHNNRNNSNFQPWSIYQTNWPVSSLDSWIWTNNRKCRMPSETLMSNSRTRINNRHLIRCSSNSCLINHKICNKFQWLRINSSSSSNNTSVTSIRASKTWFKVPLKRPTMKITLGNLLHHKLRPSRVPINNKFSIWRPIISTNLET